MACARNDEEARQRRRQEQEDEFVRIEENGALSPD
jgi:hypothetical protein